MGQRMPQIDMSSLGPEKQARVQQLLLEKQQLQSDLSTGYPEDVSATVINDQPQAQQPDLSGLSPEKRARVEQLLQEKQQLEGELAPPPQQDSEMGALIRQQAQQQLDQSFPQVAGQYLLKGLQAYESVTGAPTRAAIYAAQQGQNPLTAFGRQFAEDPSLAPTGKDIAVQAGFDDTPVQNVPQGQPYGGLSPRDFYQLPPEQQQELTQKEQQLGPAKTTPAEAAGLVVDFVADPAPIYGAGLKFGSKLGIKVAQGVRKAAGKATLAVGKRAGSVFGGVRGDVIEEYVKNAERINKSADIGEIKDQMDAITRRLMDDVENARISIKDAKDVHRDALSEVKLNKALSKADARQLVTDSKASLKRAFDDKVAEIKNVASPTELSNSAVRSVGQLKDQVIEGSQAAYDVLERLSASGKTMGTKRLPKLIQDAQDGLKISGKLVTDSAQKSFNALENFKQRLSSLPKNISLTDAKKLIQQLDDEIDFINNAGEFSDSASKAYINLRRGIDAELKDIPEYMAIMSKVSDDARLLGKVSKKFGDADRASGALSSITTPRNKQTRELLKELGNRTNIDFDKAVQNFARSREQLASPKFKRELLTGLPEAKILKKAKTDLKKINEINVDDLVAGKKSAISDAQKQYEIRRAALDKVKKLKPESSEQAIKAIGSQRSTIELEKAFKEINKLSDTDFIKAVKDYNTKRKFEQGAGQGARNVALFTFLFGAVSKGDPIMIGIGAGLGASVDRFGPALTKKAIDTILKARNAVDKTGKVTLKALEATGANEKTIRAAMYMVSGARGAAVGAKNLKDNKEKRQNALRGRK